MKGSTVGRMMGTEVPIRQPMAGVYRLRDGIITAGHFFLTWEEALEYAGVEE